MVARRLIGENAAIARNKVVLMPALSAAARDAFLQEPRVLCRVATIDPEGAPHVTPVWFVVEDGRVFITPRRESAWLRHLRRDPRVALTIDEEASPYRKVSVRGKAVIEYEPGDDERWRDLYRRIAERYIPPAAAERYIQATIDQPRALISVTLAEAQVTTWRMPRAGEPYAGIWHERYYAPGSELAGR